MIGLLRQIQDLSRLPNEIIAKLNDSAFKAIQRGGLQKMLDKRALTNESLYEKLDKEIEHMTKKFDFK